MPVESHSDKSARMRRVISFLQQHYPNARCSLDFETPHQLMVATILSAQCTDERVNMITPALFARYRSVSAFADAKPEELEQLIYTGGFYKAKARAIIKSAQQIVSEHGGIVPQKLDQLVKLSGVGRKTGSVVLGAGFGLAEGIVVDTHVARISRLLRFTRHSEPVKIEQDLMKIVNPADWIRYSHLLIYHGRSVCTARKPDCGRCFLQTLCPSAKV